MLGAKAILDTLKSPDFAATPVSCWIRDPSFPHLTFSRFCFPIFSFSLLFLIFLFPVYRVFSKFTEQKPNKKRRK